METKITDAQIEQAFEAHGYGVCIDDLVCTANTLADFIASSKDWASYKNIKTGEKNGYKYVLFESAQAKKGGPRRDILVVDFGDNRYVKN